MSTYTRALTRKPDDYYYDGDSLWGRESKRLLSACLADPSNRQLQRDLAWAEKQRAQSYDRRMKAYDRQCEDDYAAQWASWAYGPDVNPTGSR